MSASPRVTMANWPRVVAAVALLLCAAPRANAGPAPAAGAPSAPAPASAPAGPRRVLILNSFGPGASPYSAVVSAFRAELVDRSPNPIEFMEVSLETVRFDTPDEAPIVDYVRALCERRKFDLVVPNGAPAARFWLRHRDTLMPATPSLIAAVEERHLKSLPMTPGEFAVPARIDLAGAMRHILQVLPGTENVVVVIGDSPVERFWRSEIQRDWQPFVKDVRITFLNDLPFEAMLRRVAALPPRSAVFFALMLVDAAGVPYEQENSVDKLHAAASAPIFGWSDNLLGRGIVGGPLIPIAGLGRQVAHAAASILAGEKPGVADTTAIGAGAPAYDWRELRRWGIETARLPQGSAILFRPPSLLRQYRWVIAGSALIIALQALAITGLLVFRHRRRLAEEESVRLRRELAHAGRVAVMGQIASSLAHELNQPLGAILRNAEAGELYLAATPPNLDEVRAILADIRQDNHRAGSVIDGIRTFLRRHDMAMAPLDMDAVVDAVVTLVRPDAHARRVTLAIEPARDLPAVRGHQGHLQQVLLNLMLNGMEALDASRDGRRTLTVRTRVLAGDRVEIAVSDTGPGIPPEELPHIFDNFYTTKPGGMGLGLAISRRIVEAHGGSIRAENDPGGGATLRVTLPAAERGR